MIRIFPAGPARLTGALLLLLPGLCRAQGYVVTRFAGFGLPPTPMSATALGLDRVGTVTSDKVGNVYFSAYNCVFRVEVGSGELTRVAGGTRSAGYAGDGGLATNAQFNVRLGLDADGAGNLYIADEQNYVIRRVTPNGLIFTVAGNGTRGYSGDGGPATSAQLGIAAHVAADAAGNLYIADTGNNRIRKVTPGGSISTIAGTGVAGYAGDGGPATSAQLRSPLGLALDSAGALYIADSQNHRVRKLELNGVIRTVAGTGTIGFAGDGGMAVNAQLYLPEDVALDNAGNLYIADTNNHRVRRVTGSGTISTIAGGGNDSNSDNVRAVTAEIYPVGIGVDAGGNVYIAENDTGRVRKVAPDGIISTVAGNHGFGFWGDGGAAVNAQLSIPGSDAAADPAGNVYIADTWNHRVRKVSADGLITTFAGNGLSGSTGDGGAAVNAQIPSPSNVALDAAGNLYISEPTRVRRVSPSGTITSFAGNGSLGYAGDGGPATSAQLNTPKGLAADGAGSLYIVDSANHKIRKVGANGVISTIAGNGTAGYGGDAGPAANAQLNSPTSVAVDSAGNVYIADYLNYRIRRVAPNGVITTVAGTGSCGTSGDGGQAVNAQICPSGLAIDSTGIYVADLFYGRIRKILPDGTIFTVAAGAEMMSARSVAVDASGVLYVTMDQLARAVVPGNHPLLSVTTSHASAFAAGQTGATYSVVVSNHPNVVSTSGTVTVREIVPAGLSFLNMSGVGWSCPANVCTRSDPLSPGASYPPITVTVDVPPDAPTQVVNQVVVSGGGSVPAAAADATAIPGVPNPVLAAPLNAGINVPLTLALSWSAAAGATSYDVFLGTSVPPPFAGNTTATSYVPVGLASNTTYYWRIAARNGLRFAGSDTWSFTTVLTQISISGHVFPALNGVLMTLSGSQSGSTTTDVSGAYAFSGLPVGGTYTVTPAYSGQVFTPPSWTTTAVTSNRTADFTLGSVGCTANAAVPPMMRAEGVSELSGDLVMLCSGGTPTAAGAIVPQATFTLNLNTQVTSHLLSAGSEVLLAIDEPTAVQAKVCVPGTPNPGAPTDPNYCPMLGTGGDALEFKSGNANIFRGTVAGNSVTFSGVPFDPPGPTGYRVFRISNVRMNASLVPAGTGGTPGQAVGLADIVTTVPVLLSNPAQIVGFVQPSLTTAIRTADNSGPLAAPVVLQQCTPTAPTKFATLSFAEQFSTAFKRRTSASATAGGVAAQDTLGIVYNSESGYYNPNLPAPMSLAGLADFGTRVKAVFNNIPAGVILYSAVTYPETAPANLNTTTYAVLTGSETGAYAPVTATHTLDGRSAVALPIQNGSATAVWEITGANPLTMETAYFPLWISYSGPGTGTASVNSSFAPSASSSAVPRFVDTSTASPVFQIASCGATVPITVTTNPAGRAILLDGSSFTGPQTVQWTPGSSHTVGVPSPQAAGTGTRYAFASWSDGGAQTHTVIGPAAAATYTAAFDTQYLLTSVSAPPPAGSVSANPVSGDGYHASGTSVQLTATAAGGYAFASWSGDLTGNTNPASIGMSGPRSVTANFTTGYAISGKVTLGGSGLAGVTVALSGAQSGMATTDGAGNYNLGGLAAGGNYTVTPSRSGYTFTPPNQSFTSLGGNQTVNFTATAAQARNPAAVFRHANGGISLTRQGSATLYHGGGLFAGTPGAAQSAGGDTLVVARDNYNAVWANIFSATSLSWGTWAYGGGVIQGNPAVAAATNGTAYIGVRDSWNSYWLTSYTPAGGFGAWTYLAGIFSTDPAMAACGDGSIYIVGRDNWRSLWSGRYVPGSGFQGWQYGGGIIQGNPAVTCGTDNAVYVAVRDDWNSLWMARVQGNSWLGWSYGGGIMSGDPQVAAGSNGTIYVALRDTGGGVWSRGYTEGTASGWQAWVMTGGVLQDVSAAAVGGELYLAGRDGGNQLWWYRATGNAWTSIGNQGAAAGPLAAVPR